MKADAAAAPELEAFVPYLLFRISRRLNAQLRERMRHEGVTIHRWRLLSVLAARGPASLKELAARTVMEQSVISRVAKQMQDDGLVQGRPRDSDRRVVELSLTARGRALFGRIWPVAAEHGARATAPLSDAERRTLVKLLQKVLAGMAAEETA